MSTKREQIIASIKTRLDTIGASLPIYRSQVNPLARNKIPCALLEPIQDIVIDNSTLRYNDWGLIVQVIIQTRGNIPDQIADEYIEDVHNKIMEDQGLGGLSMDIQPLSVDYDIMEGDKPICSAILKFRITYRTSEKTLN